jgi:hypothetical protein
MVGLMLLLLAVKEPMRTSFAADCGLPLLGLSLVVFVRKIWSQHVAVVGELVQDVRLLAASNRSPSDACRSLL